MSQESHKAHGYWCLHTTSWIYSIYNKLNTANAVNSQISTLADKCTELNDNFYTHMIFSTLLFEYNNLLMAFNATQTKSTAFFQPTNTYSYWFFIRTAQRPALQPRQLGLAVGSNTSASSSLSQSLINRFLCSLWFAFFEAVSYRRKNTQTWIEIPRAIFIIPLCTLDNFHSISEPQILQLYSRDNKTKLERVIMRVKQNNGHKAHRKLWP